MAERPALGVVPGTGWRAREIRSVAREAEAAGFEAIFATEFNADVLAIAQPRSAGLDAQATGGRTIGEPREVRP